MQSATTVRAIQLPAVLAAVMLVGCAANPTPRPSPPPPDLRDLLTAAAIAMLDQPYRYGGAMPGGFDCSGLAQYAAAQAGIALPRTTREQQNAGAAAEFHDIQKGDLIFFHLSSGEFLHVGIYLGESRFIHAPSSGGRVRIDRLDAKPYAAGFLAARRLFTNLKAAIP